MNVQKYPLPTTGKRAEDEEEDALYLVKMFVSNT